MHGSVLYWNKKEKRWSGRPERLFHGWVQKQGCLEYSVAVIEFQYAVIPFHQITPVSYTHLSSEWNIIIGVENDDFETAIRAIYDIFVITEL